MLFFQIVGWILVYLTVVIGIGLMIGKGGEKAKAFEERYSLKPKRMGPLEYGKADSEKDDFFDELERFRSDFE